MEAAALAVLGPSSNQHMAPAASSLSVKICLPQETQNNTSFPSDSNMLLPVLSTLLSSQVEKLRSKMCGRVRDGSSGPPRSPSGHIHLQPLVPHRRQDVMPRNAQWLQMCPWSWHLEEPP